MRPENASGNAPGKLVLRLCLQAGIWLVIMAALLLGATGDWSWPQGLAVLGLYVATSAWFGVELLWRDPGLLAARLGALRQKGQPWWDKMFLLVFVGVWLGWFWLMGQDVRVWQTSHMPVWLNAAGGLVIVASFAGVMRVFRENSFAAPVVRIQSERDQRVIDTGPYAIVRHPMYAMVLPYLAGLSLLLGSWWGLAGVMLFVAGIMPRAVMEERTLKRDLPGYGDYMARVRFRLIPGIW
jgi:protein-S-isoprenylcysteine O-methyltransferase Ste14